MGRASSIGGTTPPKVGLRLEATNRKKMIMSKKGMDKALVALRESLLSAMGGVAVDCTAIAFRDVGSKVTVKSGGTSASVDVSAGADVESCIAAIVTQVATGTIASKEVIASSSKDAPIQTALGRSQRMAKRTAETVRTRDSLAINLGTILSPDQRELVASQYVAAIAADKAFEDAPSSPLQARVKARKAKVAPVVEPEAASANS